MVEALATGERVEGDVEHVVGLLVRSMEAEKLYLVIDLPVETYRLRHLMHQADAARGNRAYTGGDPVDGSGAAQHRAAVMHVALVLTLEPPLNLTFETAKLSS